MDNPPVLSEASEPCLNCGTQLTGSYCGNCGQEAKEFRRPFFRLSSEAVQSLLELDGRAFRTLFCLLSKPAYLCQEYFSGRRASYTPPLRLFLVISVTFFLLVSIYTSIRSMEGVLTANGGETDAEVPATADIDSIITLDSDIGIIDEDDDDGGDDNGLQDILSFVEGISFPFFDEQTNSNLRRAMSAQAEANMNLILEDPNEYFRGYLEYITVFMLLMIPILAFMQKIIYIRQGHFYVEHLVLTLHNHAFVILVVFVASTMDLIVEGQIPIASSVFDFLSSAIYIWMWVYLFLSLKNYFQQGYGITLLKYITTTILYGFTLSFGVLVFAVILFFLF